MGHLLMRLWNPCVTDVATHPPVMIRFHVGPDGRLSEKPSILSPPGAEESDPAARRAMRVIHQAEPYQTAFRDHAFTVIFDGRRYCSNR